MLAYEIKTNLASKDKSQLYLLFIEIDPNVITQSDKEMLRNNNNIAIDNNSKIMTAKLSVEEIDMLTNKPWIKFISKSKRMKFSQKNFR